jgi:phage terminase large subunit-like protein
MTLEQFREALYETAAEITGEEIGAKTWRSLARPEQLPPPGEWSTWLIMTGRGWGKTRTAAETVKIAVEEWGHRRLAIIGPTAGDMRDVMIEGESGLLSVFPEATRPHYEPSKQRVTFANGAVANLRSADEPRRVRGLQYTFLWADELCAWQHPTCWDIAQFGNRLREPKPVSVVTTTPVVGHELLQTLLESPRTVITRGTMRDNVALNAERLLELEEQYGGTELGRQELDGELLDTVPGALWVPEWFRRDGFRIAPAIGSRDGKLVFEPPVPLQRVVVALDPNVTDPGKRSNPLKKPDACGVSVVGLGDDHRAYVLADFTGIMSPAEWARLAVKLFTLCGAQQIIAEKNQGGQLIEDVIKNVAHNMPVELVSAVENKRSRAEPVSLLYEQGRVSHCGELVKLEQQMVTWDPTNPGRKSPNNIDALVWAFHGLGLCVATGMRSIKRHRVNR